MRTVLQPEFKNARQKVAIHFGAIDSRHRPAGISAQRFGIQIAKRHGGQFAAQHLRFTTLGRINLVRHLIPCEDAIERVDGLLECVVSHAKLYTQRSSPRKRDPTFSLTCWIDMGPRFREDDKWWGGDQ
jgi:hypothetical protein